MLAVVMGFLCRNLHILVFASVSLVVAVFVAADPGRTKALMTPVVEDAQEIRQMAVASYRIIGSIDVRSAAREAKTLYVSTLRMPSMLFERLAENLEKVNASIELANGKPIVRKSQATVSPLDFLKTLERL
ncbi:MAG: hypothetical protein ABJQ71_20480 [Roseibium sp.]